MAWNISRFDYRVVAAACLIAGLMLVPFSVHHFLAADWQLFVPITGLALLIAVVTVVVWRFKRVPPLALTIGVLASNIVIFLAVLRLREVGVYWIFPMVAANFFLLGPRMGLAFNLGFLTLTLSFAATWLPFEHFSRVVATVLVLMSFGFVFSHDSYRQREELNKLASIDPLTGAGNRRDMQMVLSNAVVAHQSFGTATSIIIIDLDHFKTINDTLGHDAGDKVLSAFAELVRKRFRQSDHLFRYGGEEFLIHLNDTDGHTAFRLADQLRETIQNTPLVSAGKVTISCGVAELRHNESVESWIVRGDEALYRGKKEGRNRVVLG